MKINSVKFLKSSTLPEDMPVPNLPEYPFAGRSNVGKSSLINALAGRKDIAKTSSQPGKTKVINHFLVDNKWYLADLPGYGYAKVSKKERQSFDRMMQDYFIRRPNIACAFLLIDSRIPPQKLDLEFAYFLGASQIPVAILFTKTDKPRKLELEKNIQAFKDEMLKEWESLPDIFLTSSNTGAGMDELRDFIGGVNKEIEERET